MLIFSLLLSLLSVQLVWLKPAANNSEPASTVSQEELRSKRQATFFDLLHRAIEKYEKCADEHLTPLKSLASYKQYETLIPGKHSPSQQANVGVVQPNVSASKPNMKCTKVNLCITNRNSADDNRPPKVGKALDTRSHIPNPFPYFPINENYKGKHPSYFHKPYDFGNILSKQNIQYSHNNQDIFTQFLKKLIALCQKHTLRTAEPEAVLGNALAKPAHSTETTFCSCLNQTMKDANLSSKHNCPCLKTLKKPSKTDGSHDILESIADRNMSASELKRFDHFLNLLLKRLEERTEKSNNKELRQLLAKLKSLKSAFDANYEGHKEHLQATTPSSLLVGAQAHQKDTKLQRFSLSNLGVSLLNTMFKTNYTSKLVKDNDHDTDIIKNTSKKANVRTSFLDINENVNGRPTENVASSHDSLFSEEEFFESHTQKNSSKLIRENVQETFKIQRPKKSGLHTKIISSNYTIPHKHAPILAHTKDNSDSLEASVEYDIVRDYFEEFSSEDKTATSILPPKNFYSHSEQPKTHHASTRVIQASVHSKESKTTQAPIFKTQASGCNLGKNDSQITISIIGDCNFKQIHVEQRVSNDKKLEINEKEQFNMGDS